MRHSRREFFHQAAAGLSTAAFGGLTASGPSLAQASLTPEMALQQLIDGNRRFAEGKMNSFDEDLSILKAKTAEKQEPLQPFFPAPTRGCPSN